MTIQTHFVPQEMAYTGEQLHSHWAYAKFDILGDSVVAFVGPCDVQPEYMKDLEDLKASSRIFSECMLHFIVEQFDNDLTHAILRQQLLIAIMGEMLNRRLGKPQVTRKGSDLYDTDRKLTVSIASVSPVSALIHAGVNISSHNTPVPTRGLADYDINPREFAHDVLAAYAMDCASANRSRYKVRHSE